MYNVAQYLESCVNSIKIENIEYEILMIDDGSPDHSYLEALKLISFNPKIRILQQENKGLGGARNLGIQNAKGKYILFLDADDLLTCQNFEFLQDLESDIIELGYCRITTSGEEISRVIPPSITTNNDGVKYWSENPINPTACNKLYKQSFLYENDLFFKENIYCEDIEFNTRAMFVAKTIETRGIILQNFIQTASSITRNTTQKKKEKLFKDLDLALKSLINYRNEKSKRSSDFFYFDKIISDISLGAINLGLKNKIPMSDIKGILHMIDKEHISLINVHYDNRKKNIFKYFVIIPYGLCILRFISKINKNK